MLIYEGNLHKNIGALSQLGAEKITFPPKPDGHTDRRMDISVYRVASLLKISSCLTKTYGDEYRVTTLSKLYIMTRQILYR